MRISAVIFDMDGTIIDSREIVLGAFKHVLEEFGEKYDEKTVSVHVGKLLENTYKDLLPKHDVAALADLHRSWQHDNKHLLKKFDGLDSFLAKIKGEGIKLGIFTSATRARADLALNGLGIREYFSAVICGDDVVRPKPDKEGVITVCRLLSVTLEETVLVGDAEHDILSGKRAGVLTIGVTHGFGTKEALERAGAEHIVGSLTELSDKLESLREK